MPTYRIVVTGVARGVDPGEARRAVARLFKMEEGSEALDALFSRAPVTVKRGLDEVRARHWVERLQRAGLSCERREEGEGPPRASLEAPSAAELSRGREQETPGGGDAWTENPYRRPEAELEAPRPAAPHRLLDSPRRLPAGEGLAWIGRGWRCFTRAPLVWFGMMLIGAGLLVGASFFAGALAVLVPLAPVAMGILLHLLAPVFTASLVIACHELERGGSIGVGHLFAGFRSNLGALLLLGLIYLVLSVVVSVVLMGVVMAPMMEGHLGSGEGGGAMALYFLFYLLLFTPVLMAYWFAPALVAIDGVRPATAMVMSLKGCLANLGPFLLYGLAGLVLAILASIPLGLGWLLLFPVVMGSIHAGYRAIFTEAAEEMQD